MQTNWNFKLFYPSRTSKKIEQDIEQAKKGILAFEKKYKGKTDYLRSELALHKALKDYEKLMGDPSASRALSYYHFRKEVDTTDKEAEAKISKLSDEFTKLENCILFFTLNLGKIDKKLQQKFLKSEKLKQYQYFLKLLFENSKYDLTEPEEKILNLKSQTSYGMWVDGVDKLVSKQTVRFKGKDLPIAEAQGIIRTLPTKERRLIHDQTLERYKAISDFAESEINAVVLHKKTNDELRGFKNPYSSTILGYENDEQSVLNLVNAVTETSRISHEFFKIKAKLLKLPKLYYADRAASVGNTSTKIPFKKAVDMYREILADTDEEFVKILDNFLEKGHIDVYPKKGKTGGAFCASEVGLPTLVLLNQTDDFKSFTTLAHEMGHAFHAELAKKQPVIYQGHTISVAETASTFFEQLSFEHIFERLPKKEKIVALHDKIADDMASVFRQIAFFNFERDLHTEIRSKGFLPKEEIAQLLNTHMKHYLGPVFKLSELDGYFFVTVSHFRRFFYVYSYAYGQLISRSMVERVKQDPTYIKQVKQFLTAGGSKSPERIFKDIGIDTTHPDFFREGLKGIEKDVEKLKELTK